MKSNPLLLTPGPTNIPSFVLEHYGDIPYHHRQTQFTETFEQVSENLRKLHQASQNDFSYILTGSGTLGMEASATNFFLPKDTVLVLVTGEFGKRFAEICTLHELDVHTIQTTPGETYDLNSVKHFLETHPQCKGVFVTHSETSTGVLNDLHALSLLCEPYNDCLLIVDSVSGLIINPLEFSNWKLDCVISASQKGYLLAPGLCFLMVSEKAHKRIVSSPRGFYTQLSLYDQFSSIQQTPFTPNIDLIHQLHITTDFLLSYSLTKYQQEKRELYTYTEKELQKLGFKNLVTEEMNKSRTILAVTHPTYAVSDLQHYLEKQNIIVAASKNKELEVLRIGFLGYISKNDIHLLLTHIQVYCAQH